MSANLDAATTSQPSGNTPEAGPPGGRGLVAKLAAIHRAAAARLRETATGILARALGGVITGEDAMLRTSMVATQLVGLAMMRYVAHLEPLASADTDTVARHYGRAVQAIVTDRD